MLHVLTNSTVNSVLVDSAMSANDVMVTNF